MFVQIEYKSFNGTDDGYCSEGYDDVEDVRQMGDLVIITRTVDGKTEEVMVPVHRILRIETNHDRDVVADARAEFARLQEEERQLRTYTPSSGLVVPSVV